MNNDAQAIEATQTAPTSLLSRTIDENQFTPLPWHLLQRLAAFKAEVRALHFWIWSAAVGTLLCQ